MDSRSVAPGVYRLGTERINWYLLEEAGRYTVVDAGLPGHFDQLTALLAALDASLDDVEALVLTHGHPDHIGCAARIQAAGVPVWIHEAETGHLRNSHSMPPWIYLRNVWRGEVRAFLGEAMRDGIADVEPVEAVNTYRDGDVLDVPGRPVIRLHPGHSSGQCVLLLEDRDVLFCGDVVVTRNQVTGRVSDPEVPPAALNENHGDAIVAARNLRNYGSMTLLPGHGPPWTGDLSTLDISP